MTSGQSVRQCPLPSLSMYRTATRALPVLGHSPRRRKQVGIAMLSRGRTGWMASSWCWQHCWGRQAASAFVFTFYKGRPRTTALRSRASLVDDPRKSADCWCSFGSSIPSLSIHPALDPRLWLVDSIYGVGDLRDLDAVPATPISSYCHLY
ncbi:hypothetical protein C8R46DRAFT_1135865 [Mycena filopes]|nr:hypothetical protein C8R46DRAFT_1135865 [Mycena filopes]